MSEEIISEIEEDLQKERIKKLWSLYGKYISSFILLVIVMIGGWQFYNYWENKKNSNASNAFLNILNLSNEDPGLAIKKIDELSKMPKGYDTLLKFKKASLLNDSGQKSEAQLIWTEIYSDNSNENIYKNMAIFFSLMNDKNQPNLLKALDDIIEENNYLSQFSKELKASIYFENERMKEAKDLLNEILTSGNINQRTQERITNILKTLEDY
jgi:hypothetical protein